MNTVGEVMDCRVSRIAFMTQQRFLVTCNKMTEQGKRAGNALDSRATRCGGGKQGWYAADSDTRGDWALAALPDRSPSHQLPSLMLLSGSVAAPWRSVGAGVCCDRRWLVRGDERQPSCLAVCTVKCGIARTNV